MTQLPQFETAMTALPPRYAGSQILRTVYESFDKAVMPMIQQKWEMLAGCDSFDAMPISLLDRFCQYFNVDMTLDERTRRFMCAWRMTTIGGYYKLFDMLDALGFIEYRIKKNADGSMTAILYSRRDASGTVLQVTDADADEFQRVFQQYGPAHLLVGTAIQRTVTFGSTDLLFGNKIIFGMGDDE